MIFNTKIQEIDTKEIVNSEFINLDFFKNSTIMVTGATGLIGSQIVNALLYANEALDTNIKILALVRNKKKADDLFYANKTNKIKYIVQDILKPVKIREKVDFIIHTANSTSSKSFVEKPTETINSIVDGTNNILKFAKDKKVKGVVYLSSMEVYGTTDFNRVEPLKEEDLGYIDLSSPRSSYPEGKRLAENLCLSYNKEFGVPVKIARLCQTIGAGVDYNDARVWAQFARNIVEKQDIVLHTKGESTRSYLYVTDAVTAIFALFEKGKDGECYNVANPDTTCSIKEMAEMLCKKYQDSKLKIEFDDRLYPPPSKLYLDITKLTQDTGFKPNVSLLDMYDRLINHFNKRQRIYTKFSLFLKNIFTLTNYDSYKLIKLFGHTFKLSFIDKFKKCYNLPVQNNKIVFYNFGGRGYGCNPKYIAEEIIKRNLPYDLIWLCKKNKNNNLPKQIRTVKLYDLKELITSKIFISNIRMNSFIRKGWTKRPEQKYIQTWHGSLGIKKIDAASNSSVYLNKEWCNFAKQDSQNIDYLLSNSDFEDNIFNSSFWYDGTTTKFGHPRNDIFFKTEKELQKIRKKVYRTLRIKENNRILLYCPTFRDSNDESNFKIDTVKIKQILTNKYNEDYEIVVRLHPNIKAKLSSLYSDNVINATNYADIQELLVAADIFITDYSSCVFDFMLSRKPAFIFATDIEKYDNERGFYYPLTSTPFPVATNNEELAHNIENFDYDKYKADVEEFLKEKGCMEDGHASERVVDLIEEIINNG